MYQGSSGCDDYARTLPDEVNLFEQQSISEKQGDEQVSASAHEVRPAPQGRQS